MPSSHAHAAAAAALVAMVAGPANAQRWSPPGYEQVWVDEFNDGEIDRSTWADFRADMTPWKAGLFSTEAAYEQLDSGKLVLDIYTQDAGTARAVHRSGGVWTAGNLHFRYGFVQARVRFWTEAGMNQAFWMTPSNGTNTCDGTGAEIDIIEHRFHQIRDGVETNLLDDYHVAIHFLGYGSCAQSRGGLVNGTSSQDASDGYHTYAVRWEPGVLEFYWDDRRVYTITDANAVISDQPSRVILSHAVFDSLRWAGQIQDDYGALGEDQRTMMKVDWVRVMQIPGDPRHRLEDLRPGAPQPPQPGSDVDMNFDGETDLFDLLDFLSLHDAGSSAAADWDRSGVLDRADVEAFLADLADESD